MYRPRTVQVSDLPLGPEADGRPSLDRLDPAMVRSRNVLGPEDRLDPGVRAAVLAQINYCISVGATDEEIAAELGIPVSIVTDYREDR